MGSWNGRRTGVTVAGVVLLLAGIAPCQQDVFQAAIAVPAGGWTVAEALHEVARVTRCRMVVQLSPEAQATPLTPGGATARQVLEEAVKAAAAERHDVGRTVVIAARQPALVERQRRRTAGVLALELLRKQPAAFLDGLQHERLVDLHALPQPEQFTVGTIFRPGLTAKTWRERLDRDGMAIGIVWDPYLEHGAAGLETRVWLRDRWRYVQFARLRAVPPDGLLEPVEVGTRLQPEETPSRFALAERVGPQFAVPDRDVHWVEPDESVFRSGVMRPTSLAALGAVSALRVRLAEQQAASLARSRPGDDVLVRFEVVKAWDLDSDPLAAATWPEGSGDGFQVTAYLYWARLGDRSLAPADGTVLSSTREPFGAMLYRIDGPLLEAGRVEEVAYLVRPQQQTPVTTEDETRYTVQSSWQIMGDGRVSNHWDLPFAAGQVGVSILDPALLPAVVRGAAR